MYSVDQSLQNTKKPKCVCLCILSYCVSELSQCFRTVTQQDLSCLLEARHPLVIPEVSQVGLRQTDKDDEGEQTTD